MTIILILDLNKQFELNTVTKVKSLCFSFSVHVIESLQVFMVEDCKKLFNQKKLNYRIMFKKVTSKLNLYKTVYCLKNVKSGNN